MQTTHDHGFSSNGSHILLALYLLIKVSVKGMHVNNVFIDMSSLWYFQLKPLWRITMASFTKMLSGRNTAVLLASLGAGTVATGYMLSDNAALSAKERTKLYPPRWMQTHTHTFAPISTHVHTHTLTHTFTCMNECAQMNTPIHTCVSYLVLLRWITYTQSIITSTQFTFIKKYGQTPTLHAN